MKKLRPPFKTHSGKYYLTAWIIENFPTDFRELEYCDLCCGGGSVFLNKDPSVAEILNDCDKGITSIFKALRDDPKTFIAKVKQVKYSEKTFEKVFELDQTGQFDDYVDYAVNEFVLRRMSRNGLKKSFAWTNRVRGGQPGDINAWETMLEQLPVLAERMKNISIINQKFQELIKIWDESNVFMFVDPPHLPLETDGTLNEEENEMSVEDHIKFLNSVKEARAKMMICGYDCMLYSKHLKGWRVVKKKVENPKHKSRKHYSLWMNY